MTLSELVARERPIPWAEGSKIPWDEPGFSARMLREHLSQHHDRASRRFEIIDEHVAWIHENVLAGTASSVLDLGCGPGFYSARLARRGHACVGIDFSPASLTYARAEAAGEALRCEYRLRDLRKGQFGSSFQAALLVSGEFNTFPLTAAQALLVDVRRALAAGGVLVLEVHSAEFVRTIGESVSSWFTAKQGVFCDEPHVCLRECFWFPDCSTAVERYFVAPASTGRFAAYTSTTRAYSRADYESMLSIVGFGQIEFHASLAGDAALDDALFVIVARAAR